MSLLILLVLVVALLVIAEIDIEGSGRQSLRLKVRQKFCVRINVALKQSRAVWKF